MDYRYIEQSGQGLRYDVVTPGGERLCIAHSKRDAKMIVQSLNRKKILDVRGEDGDDHAIYGDEFAAMAIGDVLSRLNTLEAKAARKRGHNA